VRPVQEELDVPMHCRVQVVLAAVQSPLLDDRKRASLLIPRICNIILNAPNSCRHVSFTTCLLCDALLVVVLCLGVRF
jgi:hypothetical protein